MSEKLADVCLAMANDIIEMTTGKKSLRHTQEAHKVAGYLFNCSTKGALHWGWVNSIYSGDQETSKTE